MQRFQVTNIIELEIAFRQFLNIKKLNSLIKF